MSLSFLKKFEIFVLSAVEVRPKYGTLGLRGWGFFVCTDNMQLSAIFRTFTVKDLVSVLFEGHCFGQAAFTSIYLLKIAESRMQEGRL